MTEKTDRRISGTMIGPAFVIASKMEVVRSTSGTIVGVALGKGACGACASNGVAVVAATSNSKIFIRKVL